MAQSNNEVFKNIPSPCFVLEETLLNRNLAIFARVQKEAPIRIMLALKGFSLFHSFPQIRTTLQGASASSLWEARLAAEEFGSEVHVYSPAYRDRDLLEILPLASHLTFNSISQWEHFRSQVTAYTPNKPSVGLRINPQYSSSSNRSLQSLSAINTIGNFAIAPWRYITNWNRWIFIAQSLRK